MSVRRTLELCAFSDEAMADFPTTTLEYGEGASGWVALRREIYHCADRFRDTRFAGQDWATASQFDQLPRRTGDPETARCWVC